MYNDQDMPKSEQTFSGMTLLKSSSDAKIRTSAPWRLPQAWDREARGIRHIDYSSGGLPLFPEQLVNEIRRKSSTQQMAARRGAVSQNQDSWWSLGLGNMIQCCAQRDRDD
eukprot:TRINITY_DN51965_c0_g1_i1.p1 TRINITY_DN51965_c0_g1~~TRINITY_DN51965_c0_g1_i1.p1  ORF type:complete len:111 (+),score=22.32 TRINITY_DN51965_c0_g1_i1:63-395(+)